MCCSVSITAERHRSITCRTVRSGPRLDSVRVGCVSGAGSEDGGSSQHMDGRMKADREKHKCGLCACGAGQQPAVCPRGTERRFHAFSAFQLRFGAFSCRLPPLFFFNGSASGALLPPRPPPLLLLPHLPHRSPCTAH